MNEWIIWQLADSGFPAGGFAHSFGLEAAWQQGEVTASTLPSFVRDVVIQAGRGGLPFVAAAHANVEHLADVDERCDVFLRNPVANRASRVQGRAWLATVERAFPGPAMAGVSNVAHASAMARHHAPVFGATLGALDVDLP